MGKAVSELNDVLLELRYAGIRQLPQAGDKGDERVRQSLAQEITHPRRRFQWTRRKVAIGGFSVTPAVLVAVVATAAAATGGAVFAANGRPAKPATKSATNSAIRPPISSPTALFRKDPGWPGHGWKRIPANIFIRKETVIPASVRARVSTTVPDYGRVRFWAATTKQGGFCSAIELPDGSWAGYPFSQHPTDGFYGGTVPGCIDTEQQRSIGELGQPSVEAPTTHEGFDDEVKTKTGHVWALFFGYVTTQGHAAIVKDPASDSTARVTPAGYFLLVEPPSSADDSVALQVLDVGGQPLQPDFTRSGLLPGYKMGPTSGPRP